ncbi:restriction endonuclease subunit S [Providencia rettgeri]|uniref:restriction endonuclease subunit S n=1 Tax=Providencia TaxID=586 RepID=UPI00155F19E5|nr:restriction endonuclease subunit S [Providencia rettgeri]EHZ7763238.1 restriction endonuclease subunit S [Providencia rettgeri]EIJ7166380.1 restriction endonuclease subunit S [Providencia rettgeri]EJD6047031.1 restriction endonuclease subunit S [Providencia rettgeri]ELR5091721.1 restriction endonuclease subunit S [Providencia rettgeri]ELR5105215.1 restriction endonuclease subunit S [Providencia rettgeri]
MVGRYKVYPEYKDSGVEWVGEIPTYWFVKPTFSVFDPTVTKNTEGQESIVLSLSYGNIIERDVDTNFGLLPESFNTYQIVNDGDLILRLTDLQNDKKSLRVGLVKQTGIITSAYLKLKANKSIEPRFAYRLLHSYDTTKVFYGMGGGLRQSMKFEEFRRLPILIPPLEEQHKIANFLDHETAKIDTLIAKQEKLIELLQEKRQAVISRAVTKGLNPDVPMKDSGVEWLGEVPEHWVVSKLGLYANKIGSGKTPKGGADVYQDEGVLFLRSQNVYDDGLRISGKDATYISNEIHVEMQNSAVKPNDVLLNITGGSIGRTCIFPANVGEANVNQHVCILRFDTELAPYLANVMKSSSIKEQIDIVQVGGNREGLNFEQIANMKFCIPPKAEILKINSFIDSQLTKFNSLILKSISVIELMKERKTALISAAVTGKIDVRDWQPKGIQK